MTEAATPKQEVTPKQFAAGIARHIDRNIAYSGPGIRHDVGRVQIDFNVVNNTGRNQRAIQFKFLIGPQQEVQISMLLEKIQEDPEGYTAEIFERLRYMMIEARNNNIEVKRQRNSSIILPDDAGRFTA